MCKNSETTLQLRVSKGSFGKLCLDLQKDFSRFNVRSSEVPTDLRRLILKSYDYTTEESSLCEFLSVHEEPLDILVEHEGKLGLFHWDRAFQGKAGLEFNYREGVISIQGRCYEDGEPLTSVVLFGSHLLLDTEKSRCGYLEEDGRRAFSGVSAHLDIEFSELNFQDSMTVLVGEKQTFPFDISGLHTATVFCEGLSSKLTEITLEDCGVGMSLNESDFDGVKASLHWQFQGQPLYGFSKEVHGLIQELQTGFVHSKIPFNSSTLSDILRFIRDPDFNLPEDLSELQDWGDKVRGAADRWRRLLFYTKGSWVSLSYTLLKEFEVYFKLIDLVQNQVIDYDKFPYLTLNKVKFEDMLPSLVSGFNTLQWELNFLGKDVVYSSVDVDFDFDFESPEIQFNPTVKIDDDIIPLSQLERIDFKWGLLEKDGQSHYISSEKLSLFQWILGAFKENGSDSGSSIKLSKFQLIDFFQTQDVTFREKLPEKLEGLFQFVSQKTIAVTPSLPKAMKAELRDYQVKGYEWLCSLYACQLGGCLADDMGLGKTIQTLTFLQGVKEGCVPSVRPLDRSVSFLVVIPPSLCLVWMTEAANFFPELRVFNYSEELLDSPETWDILLISYDLLRRAVVKLKTYYFDVVIFDEAQLLKNPKTARRKSIDQLSAPFRICLTGTPLENHVSDYMSIMDVAVPGIFDDSKKKMDQGDKTVYLDFVIHRTKPFVLRRTKALLNDELPDKTIQQIELPMQKKQKKFYADLLQVGQSLLSSLEDETIKGKQRMLILTTLLRLRQICLSPALLDDDYDQISPKLSILVNELPQICDEGDSVVVFSQFTSFLDLIEANSEGFSEYLLRIDGSTPKKKREKIIREFDTSETPKILLASLKVGGVGLNLTQANVVYLMDPWWNPAVEQQATDRIYRIGQQKKVFIKKLIMKESIEEKICLLQEQKSWLFSEIFEKGLTSRSGGSFLNKEDLSFLLQTF